MRLPFGIELSRQQSNQPTRRPPCASPPTSSDVPVLLDAEMRRDVLLLELFKLYASVMMQADTNDYNRTSVFTLIQGLLIVAFEQSLSNGEKWFGVAVGIVGVVLSVAWMLVEQRTLLYFNVRARIIRGIETQLTEEMRQTYGYEFQPFWTAGDAFLTGGASWYQKASAQKMLRLYLPWFFACAWGVAAVFVAWFVHLDAHVVRVIF